MTLSWKAFLLRISKLFGVISSKTGTAFYTGFDVRDGVLRFLRLNTGKAWELDIRHLYDIYCENGFINTATIKRYGNHRINSPSVAVLMAIGCIDRFGQKIG
ncbi:MAG TPA: hypothetical protein VD993_15370 [Chitinophagaceae bacterium]|nr:hypothetical protein [Chitinophagaceae bacterium]